LGAFQYTRGKKYDLLFATTSRLFTGFLGALLAKKTGARLYLDIRDIFSDTLKNVSKNPAIRFLLPLIVQIEKFTVNSACSINLVSRGFHNYFKKIKPDQNFSFYSNGIDDEFLDFDFQKKVKTDKKIILYAGNIGEGQGLEKILPISAKLLEDTCEFWVIGDGGRKNKLVEAIQKEKLQNIKLIEPVSRKELIAFYAKSDYLFLHLNNYKAFEKVLPSKLFEFAATGKTILAGVNGFAKEFIGQNVDNAWVFEPCNVQDFIEKYAQSTSKDVRRKDFIQKYRRTKITAEMVKSFLNCSHQL
jgi:glycosyltransferase involved in cell wall biosynthesis